MDRMINVLIIDDETAAREIIKHYLSGHSDITVAGEADNGFDGMKMISRLQPDLVFLDVQMPKLNGFELLELLEQPPHIIFSTAFDEYAIKAFELNAVDYLLKPYGQQRFFAALNKAIEKINRQQPSSEQLPKALLNPPAESLTRVAVKDRQEIHVIPIQHIHYLEADGDYVKLHSSEGSFLKEKTMKYFEENLPRQQFVRIHRSYIVNVDQVAKIALYEKDKFHVHLKNNTILKASLSGYKALKEVVKL
jgi:two-component system LytT family response regulator